jgi:hypothetical protein
MQGLVMRGGESLLLTRLQHESNEDDLNVSLRSHSKAINNSGNGDVSEFGP